MKNFFKKLSILALSTVCLLANSQITAMEKSKSESIEELKHYVAVPSSDTWSA